MHPSKHFVQAFTLIEMLAVIAIATIILGAVLPAVTGLSQNRSMTGNVATVSGLVEQARQAAMAQNTYVWLGIAQIQINGSPALAFAAIAGSSGQPTDYQSASTYRLITPTQVLKNLSLSSTNYQNLKGANASNTDFASSSGSGSSSFTFSLTMPGNFSATTFTAIEFKPDGEVSLYTSSGGSASGAALNGYVGIGLTGGVGAAASHQVAGIQISGLSGQQTVLRL